MLSLSSNHKIRITMGLNPTVQDGFLRGILFFFFVFFKKSNYECISIFLHVPPMHN